MGNSLAHAEPKAGGNLDVESDAAARIEKLKRLRYSAAFVDEVFNTINATHDISHIEHKPRERFGLAYFVDCWLHFTDRHGEDDQAIPMHHQVIGCFYGERGFGRLLHVFDQGGKWSKRKGIARALKPKPELMEVLQNMKAGTQKGRLLQFDGERVKSVRQSKLAIVPYKNNRHRTLEQLVDTNPVLNVDMIQNGADSLTRLIKMPRSDGGIYADKLGVMRDYAMATATRQNPTFTAGQIRYAAGEIHKQHLTVRRQLLRKLLKNVDSEGRLRQVYHESENGRVFGRGLHLQSLPKLVTETALAGCTAYDLWAAHYTLLAHVAKVAESEHGVSIPHDLIADYVANKDARRPELATRLSESGLNITRGQAKTLFARLPCGGSLKDINGNDVDDMLGQHKKLLFSDDYYVGLHDQVKAVTNFMIGPEFSPVDKYNRTMKNAVGLHMEAHRPKSELKAFQLFGLERLVINTTMKAHYNDGLQLPVLDKHDEWATVEPQCPIRAVNAVRNATGINIRINTPKTYMAAK